MDQRTELGEFLRSRRARLRPEDVGLPDFGRRRVPGLRREELAGLAGVSVDYYVRLEQGRARNVSSAVLDAVARALRLDDDEHTYLRAIARPVSARRRTSRPERVRPGLQRLLDVSVNVPAYVVGRRVDVLAWNRLACLLYTDFAARAPERRNWARMIFQEQEIRDLFDDWTVKARETVSYLRMRAGAHPADPDLIALVGELSVTSEEFRHWWASHEVHDKSHGRKRLRHPVVGDLVLDYEALRLPSDPDQVLVTYTAEAGSASEEALTFLSSWSADSPDHAERAPGH
ncbi:XRE family transcriptional regulator [Actinomadura spongiicola]|uniref:XRE family transcriptional regulator n=1 Tax=Actinomadura spongiicola TaxID=2303421 RepID=A0A372GCJ0_9ACTN|nr:helix-turn-helix transcriptional regulator [Actinomadura spongiicola]RFS83106.1 XRE family transcriptional regulator [Actinomadura spongiicola]